jgi:sporulation protein YlmC with PRC-barrel domain
MSGDELYLGAHLLDRQLLDREGRRCGKVDDLELTVDEATGSLFVTAIACGPGALLERAGRRRSGRWLRRVVRLLADGDDPGRIPVRHIATIGNHVTLDLEAGALATEVGERWVRDHVIAHLPGSGIDAGE